MKVLEQFVRTILSEGICRTCGDVTGDDTDTCEQHKDEPTKLQLLPVSLSPFPGKGLPVHKTPPPPDNGRPRVNEWKGF